MGTDNVPYEKIVNTATAISKLGEDLSVNMQTAWKSIDSMHGQWDGDRWTAMATSFNDAQESVNKFLKYVAEEFSKELGSIGSAYTMFDTGSTKEATISSAKTVQQITTGMKGEGKLKFDADTISSLHTEAMNSLKQCSELCQNITKTFGELSDWTGETGEGYRGKINSANEKAQSDLDKLKDDFDKAMTETLSQYNEIKSQIDSKK